jgi:hypothetical protein
MLQPFDHRILPPKPIEERAWHLGDPLANVQPTRPEGEIFRRVAQISPSTIHVQEIARRTEYTVHHVMSVCRQLAVVDVLRERPVQSGKFMVNDDQRFQEMIEMLRERMGLDQEHHHPENLL